MDAQLAYGKNGAGKKQTGKTRMMTMTMAMTIENGTAGGDDN